MWSGRGSDRRRHRCAVTALGAAAVAALGACGSGSDVDRERERTNPPPRLAFGATESDFDARSFSDPTRIDNRWSPLVPGTRFVYEGRANRGEGRLPHRVVFTVTDLTKVINGVRSVVLWDRDFNGGRLREGELAFHAQDDHGNIWNMGEYPEEYERGRLRGAPDTWIAGLAGAKPGILMRGLPRTGTSSYLQGWAPAIEFSDRAKVHRTGAARLRAGGVLAHVLVTDESKPLEPADGHQRKCSARRGQPPRRSGRRPGEGGPGS